MYTACFILLAQIEFEIRPILSKAVSPPISHTCSCAGSVFLLLQNMLKYYILSLTSCLRFTVHHQQ